MKKAAVRLVKIAAGLLAVFLLLAAAGLLVLRTGWFHEKLRNRVVAEIEKATGGDVQIDQIRYDPRRWYARLDGLTIHGKEGPGQEPLFHAQAIELNLRLVSFFKPSVDVAALRILTPEIHLRVAQDGTTNLPGPATKTPGRLFTEDLLKLAVGRFEVQDGALWWNDRRYELQIALSDLKAQVQWERAGRYQGHLEARRAVVSSPPRLPAIESVAAKFQILRDRIEISELYARTPHSEVRSSVVVGNLSQPRWQWKYNAAVDARELAAALLLPDLTAGRVQIQGSYDSDPKTWTAGGTFSAQRMAAAGKEFRLANVSASGSYAVDPHRLRVEGLGVRLLGGQWKGRLTADYSPPGRAILEGRAEGIRLEAVTEALATPSRPLTRPGWAAVLNGPLNAESALPVTARSFSAEADLILTPGPAETPAPLQGVVRASYQGRSSEIQLAEVRLATSATTLAASGRLSEKGDSNILFHLETAHLSEVTGAAFAATGKEIEIPLRLDGRAVAQGRFSGALERPEVDTRLEISRFAYNGRDWDSFSGRAEWSRRRARLTGGHLTKGQAAVNVSLTAELDDGKYTDASPIVAEIAVRQTEAQDLAAWWGQALPLTGALSGTLKLEGKQKDPRGAGSLELRRGTLWDEPFDSLQAALLLEAGEVRVNNLRVLKAKGAVRGSGAFHPGRRTFRFDVRGENLALSDQRWLAATGNKVAGSGSFALAGSGRLAAADSSLETLAGEGTMQLREVALNGRAIGNLSAAARTVEQKLRIELQSDFLGARIKGDGEVLLRERFPVQARVEFGGLDLRKSLQTAGVEDQRAQGSGDGFVVLAGEIARPETIQARGTVTRLEVGWPQAGNGQRSSPLLRNAEPATWRLESRKLTLESLHLAGEGSDLRSSGVVDFGPGDALKLSLQGSLNLAVVSTFDPRLASEGLSTLHVDITGTRQEPNLTGRLEIREASLGTEDLPISLSRINGVLVFSRQRATIQKLTAEAGGGPVRLTGHADFAGGPITYRVRVEAQRVRLRYPQGLTSMLDGVLTFTGANQRSRLEGEIQIARAGTKPSVDLATILAGLRQPTRTPSSSDWLQGAQLNVSIVSAPDIRLETSLARHVEADVNLRVRGTVLNPALLGRVNITQGEIEFQGTRYILNRGDISFANPFRIEPILNLDLETRVSGYDITLTLIGPLDKLNVTYRSDPPLTFDEVITLLAVGRAPGIDPTLAARQSAQARALSQLGASTVIGEAITKPVSGRLERFFGVSRLKVDPQIAGPGGNATARVTVEQQVGRDITFTYVSNLASAQEQIVRVEWTVNRQWSLVAIRDQNGLFGVDFLYKKRFR